MLIVNLYAGPGSGKSTGAAYIFSQLKMLGVNAELVTEFAKDKVWEDNKKALANQAYMFGKQYYRISRLEGQVDVVITDSPLLLCMIYNKDPRLGEDFNRVIQNVANGYDSLNYFIKRVKEYNPKGRLQTEKESDAINKEVKSLMDKFVKGYETVNGDLEGYDKIVEGVKVHLLFNKAL